MKNDHGPPTTTACQGLLIRGLPVHVSEPHLPMNHFLRRVLYRRYRVRVARFNWSLHCGRCYSSQEYLADEKLLDIPIESS
jgi:hypothetical protein